MELKSYFNCGVFILFALIAGGCASTSLDIEKESDASKSFAYIKKLYTNGIYDKTIEQAQKFKVKYIYSKYFSELDLLVAESYLKLEDYVEATASFRRFLQFYPKHPQRAYVLYKVGDTYWQQAPVAVDREQSFALKAIEAWEEMLKLYPESHLSEKVKKLIGEGRLRLLRADQFITQFYCKQGVWHACAYRALQGVKRSFGHKKIEKDLLQKSATAFKNLARLKTENKEDVESNLYFRDMSLAELEEKAIQLQKQADRIQI